MLQFSLSLSFEERDLQNIEDTDSKVVIAKPSESDDPNVAWLTFDPFPSNQVVWEEKYGIYASTAEIQNGAQLTQLASTGVPAAPDKIYTLLPAAYFSPPEGVGSKNAFTAINAFDNLPAPANLTFGLYQDANVNGVDILGNAVSAAPVLFNSTAIMTPYTTVFVWIQSQIASNTVCTIVTSPLTQVTFGGEVDTVSLAYNPLGGNFIPTAG